MSYGAVMRRSTLVMEIAIVCLAAILLGCIEQDGEMVKPAETELVLSDYLELFEKDVMIVIGSNTSGIEIEGADAIAENLFNLTGNMPVIETDAEITKGELAGHNLIIVGNPITNHLVQNIYDSNQDLQTRAVNSYWEGTHKGSLLLFVNPWVHFWGPTRYVLAVDGFDENGTKSAIDTLLDEEAIKKFHGTGIITKWDEGVISWDVADTVTRRLVGSIALEYMTSEHQTYPEAHFSVTNATSQNGEWLVEIGTYSKIRKGNETQTKFHGVSGRLLISKTTGNVKEVK